MSLGELLQQRALEHPESTAIISGSTPVSYAELDSAATRVACWLLGNGLRPGGRCALHWHNSFEAAALYFGAFRAGVIAVPVNLRLKPPEIAHLFENSGATVCFSSPPFAPLAQAAATSVPAMRTILTELPGEAAEAPLPPIDPAATAVIMYTSGTTARPKGARSSHQGFLAACSCVKELLISESGQAALCTTPMMHVAALAMVVGSIYCRGSAVLLPGFDPAAILDAIERYRCVSTIALPALLQFIMDEQARKPRDVSSLRTVLVGGDTVPGAMQQRFRELFGLPLQEFYGITEGGFVSVNPRHDIREGSMGKQIPMQQLRVVDPAGRDVPEGETGEVILRGPSMSQGYWNDPEASAGLMLDGWLRTGDLARRDADGYLWFRGRAKQIIVRAGSNISPQEVEEAIYQHPAVREAGVVGKPDPVFGELVVAFVALRRPETPGDEAELRAFARQHLADYKAPEQILFLPELPRGLTGKVDRRALKEKLLASL